ncbi:8-amino-7-oxononanoate synthase [Candidatus Zixiibacteriota bacterium]|nr:8-amino-7-oxononanoate synthase [candidate division Zixibacteria bacterium]
METEEKTVSRKTDLFEKCYQFKTADEVKAMGIYPYFHPISSAPGNEVVVDGKKVIMVGSNNYLGLTDDPRVKNAAAEAVRKYGSGCTGSRFLNGTLDLHIELEDRLAKFMKRDGAIVFSTGFQTNLGTVSCVVGKNDVVVIDRGDHASIVDACRLSFGKIVKFGHNDMQDLERVLKNVTENRLRGGLFIVADGVFSMEGDIIKLPELVRLARKYGARVMIDDAHAIGVLGEGGRGTAEHFHLDVDITMGTFSKSFASLGGFIVADKEVINYIKHFSREFIFSASIPPSAAAAALAALDIIETEPERRENLWRIARRMKKELQGLGFNTLHSETPIIPVVIGEDLDTFRFWKALYDDGVFANPTISPAVPPGQALIRTSYTATHTEQHLDRVLEVFEKVGKQMGIIS